MPLARKHQIILEETKNYHCIGRCVRRAFLCGQDNLTKKDYSHRKEWIIERLNYLCKFFSIKICAYAIMSNHYHLVLNVDDEQALKFSAVEVLFRGKYLFGSSEMIERYLSNRPVSLQEYALIEKKVNEWRTRLMTISWFMRCLNEYIARRANAEDECTGRFWEGRFKSQALLDEAALLSCMAYVDLNPIRAGNSQTLEESHFTSIQKRLIDNTNKLGNSDEVSMKTQNFQKIIPYQKHTIATKNLLKFVENGIELKSIPCTFIDYLELVEWTGRSVRNDKKGAIPEHVISVFEKFNINQTQWLPIISHFDESCYRAIGELEKVQSFCKAAGRRWAKGVQKVSQLYHSIAQPPLDISLQLQK